MNRKLLLWLSGVLMVFTLMVLAVELHSEHYYKKEILESKLEIYADLVAETINGCKVNMADSIIKVMPY